MYPSEGEWGRATVMRELMGIRFGRGVRAQSCISWSDALPSSVVQHQGKALCSQYNYTGVAAGGARKTQKRAGRVDLPQRVRTRLLSLHCQYKLQSVVVFEDTKNSLFVGSVSIPCQKYLTVPRSRSIEWGTLCVGW